MYISAQSLMGRTISARDGEIGRSVDWLIDQQTWSVRFLVIDTGHWLPGRKVVLPPAVVEDAGAERINVNVTMGAIESGPPLDEHAPISRQYEMAWYKHHGWPVYWEEPGGAWSWFTIAPSPSVAKGTGFSQECANIETSNDLRSTAELIGYSVQTEDGESAGKVTDLFFDPTRWVVCKLEISASWKSADRRKVSVTNISEIRWGQSQIRLTNAPSRGEDRPDIRRNE